jgi:hypothetical protein
MVTIKEIDIQKEGQLTVLLSFPNKVDLKSASMANEIIRGLISNNFSVETSFGYDENFQPENIFSYFKNKKEIEYYIIKYVYGKGIDVGAIYKLKKIE